MILDDDQTYNEERELDYEAHKAANSELTDEIWNVIYEAFDPRTVSMHF